MRDSLFCEYTSLDPCKIWQVIGRTDGNGFGARAVMISLKPPLNQLKAVRVAISA